MSTPVASLFERVSDALGRHDVDPDVARAVRAGYARAGTDPTWEMLDPGTQALIVRIEATPLTSWDDPADVPGASI